MRKILSLLMVTLFSVSLFAATYTVAGDNTTLFGKTWTPGETANDMTLVSGLYTFTKTDVVLGAGIVEFKVCQDHAWSNCWPSSNYQLSIPSSGMYDITITFNESSKAVNATATKKGDAVVIPSIAMHGNFTGSWTDTENFTLAEDKNTATLKLTMAAGNYEFGMRIGGAGNWTSNGAAFTRENPSAVVTSGSGNLTLKADATGEYTFTWTYETNTLAITFPAQSGEIIVPSIAMHGNFLGEWANTENFTLADNKETATLKLTLAKGDFEFGMRIGGSDNWTSNGVAFTRENHSAVVVAGEGNLTLAADAAGEYTFTWTYASNTLAITFPEQGDEPGDDPDVVFTVNVPAGTANVFISGSFNDWADFVKMSPVEGVANQFTVTIKCKAAEVIYKYSAGPNWAYEEQNAEGGYVGDRSYNALDEVGKWKAVPGEIKYTNPVFTVNVPAGTDSVFLAGSFNNWVGFVKMSQVEGVADQFTVTIDGEFDESLAYKYCAGPDWAYVEVDDAGEYLPNDRSYTELDNVVRWKAVPQAETEMMYYLVGNFTNWELNDDDMYKFEPNGDGGEYMISASLKTTDALKVVGVAGGNITTWFPEGEGNAYGENGEITASGKYTIYFRPDGQGAADWFYGVLFALYQGPEDGVEELLDETQTSKILRNGSIFILKNGNVYTITGQIVK